MDETSFRVDKKNIGYTFIHRGDLTLKFLHRKQGKEAIESINIIPRYGGAIIHDCWSSYFSYQDFRHGLCGSHLLRELTFTVEANNYRWAKNMKRLLQETCRKVSKNKDKKLSETELANLQKRYQNILTRGDKELPPSVFLFSKDPHVAFTNNRAEQDLRMANKGYNPLVAIQMALAGERLNGGE